MNDIHVKSTFRVSHNSIINAILASSIFVSMVLMAGCPQRAGSEDIVITITDENGQARRQALTAEDVLQAARSEGEVNWYTSVPEDQAQKFASLFENKYPQVRVRITRESTFDIVSRVEAELRSDHPVEDVIHVLDPAIFISLRKRGELYRYEPTESKVIPPQYKDPGYWTGARLVTVCLAYNPEVLPEQQVPRTWRDLLDPKWTRKIALKDAHTGGSAYAQYHFLREKYGFAFWEQLAHLKPIMYKSEDQILEALVAREVLIGGGVLGYKVYQYKQLDSQPVQEIWPEDGVPVCLGPVAILRNCPHPNAAKLLVEFMLSQQGQEAISHLLGSYSTRPDVDPPNNWVSLSELKLLRAEDGWEDYMQKQDSLRAEYGRLFSPEAE